MGITVIVLEHAVIYC